MHVWCVPGCARRRGSDEDPFGLAWRGLLSAVAHGSPLLSLFREMAEDGRSRVSSVVWVASGATPARRVEFVLPFSDLGHDVRSAIAEITGGGDVTSAGGVCRAEDVPAAWTGLGSIMDLERGALGRAGVDGVRDRRLIGLVRVVACRAWARLPAAVPQERGFHPLGRVAAGRFVGREAARGLPLLGGVMTADALSDMRGVVMEHETRGEVGCAWIRCAFGDPLRPIRCAGLRDREASVTMVLASFGSQPHVLEVSCLEAPTLSGEFCRAAGVVRGQMLWCRAGGGCLPRSWS